MDEKLVGTISVQGSSRWKVYVDGAANQRGSGVGLVLISPEKITIEKSLRLGFSVTNNEAEYEALLQGMTMVHKIWGGGGEGNGSVLGLEIGYGPSEGGARGQRCENAGVLESGQALVIGF